MKEHRFIRKGHHQFHFIALAVLAVARVYKALLHTGPLPPSVSFQSMKINRLTGTGKTSEAAISPDGKYIVYVTEEAGQQSLRLRHLPTNSEKEIIAPAALGYRGLSFSHDSQVAFSRRIERSGESALIVMKTDGTGERKLLTRGAQG